MTELLIEIWISMRKNKLRTILTGFSIAWGIFMLMILLGSGNGLQNSVLENFGNRAKNSITIYNGWTMRPYAGYGADRQIETTNDDIEILKNEFKEVDEIGPRKWFGNKIFTRATETTSIQLEGASPEEAKIAGFKVVRGRTINKLDMDELRKVIIIDKNTRDALFPNEDPIGKNILSEIGQFTVIGECDTESWDKGMRGYIPTSTGQAVINAYSPKVSGMILTVNGIETKEAAQNLSKKIKKRMSIEHKFDPEDEGGLWIRNTLEAYMQVMMIFAGISLFVWIIGIGTLTAGIVGVSNIMLVTIRERTNEFGVRKALGAKPRSIIMLVLLESVLITTIFGYIGMVLGVGAMEIVNTMAESAAEANPEAFATFKNPTVDLKTAFSATVVLILAGLIAGYVPARRAARLKTIDAMRFNK